MAAAWTVVLAAAVLGAVAASDIMSDVTKCSGDQDVSSCLKVTALRLLDSALATDSLTLSDSLSVDRRLEAEDSHVPPSLPRDFGHNVSASALDNMLMDRVHKLFTTRTINFHHKDDEVEGRGRKGYKKPGKGGGLYLAMFGGVGLMLLKLALATLALLAGKALLVAKVALLLASVFGLKNLLAQQPQEKHASQVIYAEPEIHHGAWSRSTQIPEAAHDIAYRGQRAVR